MGKTKKTIRWIGITIILFGVYTVAQAQSIAKDQAPTTTNEQLATSVQSTTFEQSTAKGKASTAVDKQSTTSLQRTTNVHITVQPEAEPGSFDIQVQQWIDTLSGQKGFEQWADSTWTSFILGPGMRGWVILITQNHQEVGYLIVHSSPEGDLSLTEYGTGERPMFSQNVLQQALDQQQLLARGDNQSVTGDRQPAAERIPVATSAADRQSMIPNNPDRQKTVYYSADRLYYSPFSAFWEVTFADGNTQYIDAKTGELLPVTYDQIQQMQGTLASTRTDQVQQAPAYADPTLQPINPVTMPIYVTETVWNEPFDPWAQLNWVIGQPMKITTPHTLQGVLNNSEKLTYTVTLFDETFTIPAALIGYQTWDGLDPYFIFDYEGPKFIAYQQINNQGNFYK